MVRSLLLAVLLGCSGSPALPNLPIGSGGGVNGPPPYYMRIVEGVPPKDHAPVWCQADGLPGGWTDPSVPLKIDLSANNTQVVCGEQPWSPGYNVCAADNAWHSERNPRNGAFTACTYDYPTHTFTFNAK